MRRLLLFAIVVLLGFGPLAVRSVSARSWEGSEAWLGVTVGEPIPYDPEAPQVPFQLLAHLLGAPPKEMDANPASISALLDEAYPVEFKNGQTIFEHSAYIPEVQGTEFMVVIVASGEFVLDVKGPGSFLVDPDPDNSPDQLVEIMRAKIDGTDVRYEPTGLFVPDEKGQDCTRLCTVLPGVAVQVTAGDRIIAPAGAICIWCLLNRQEQQAPAEGLVYAFPLLDDTETFSWEQYGIDGPEAATEQKATPAADAGATSEGLVQAIPWAFFNPAGNCRSP
jgi:hypothetical protein